MKLTIKDERIAKAKTITFSGTTVKQLLEHLKINPQTVLIVRSNEVLTSDITLNDKDTIEILSVVSGG